MSLTLNELCAAGGRVQLPGNMTFSETLTIDQPMHLEGFGEGVTTLTYTGTGPAIDIVAPEYVTLSGFRLDGTGANDDGIRVGHAGTNGYRHRLQNLRITNFPGRAVAALSCEHNVFEDIFAYNCGTGFYADMSRNTVGGLGLGNVWRRCRSQVCGGDGYDINAQIIGLFEQCEALNNGAPNAQFFMRGNTFGCEVRGLDVEASAASTVGARIVGERHLLSGVYGFQLAVGLDFVSATRCVVQSPPRLASCTTPVRVGSTCTNIRIHAGGYTVTDTGTGTTILDA